MSGGLGITRFLIKLLAKNKCHAVSQNISQTTGMYLHFGKRAFGQYGTQKKFGVLDNMGKTNST
jgi:hypothetical protein